MKIIVADDYSMLSKAAADIIEKLINSKSDAVLGLATGSTPVQTYEELIERYNEKKIDFSNIKTINLDEYIGLDGSNTQSYRYFMNEKLFNYINIDKKNTFLPNGAAEDIEKECRDYDKRIDEMGGIDLQILGIGNNGHIAFNEPNEYLNMNTHVTDLTEDTIQANARFFNSLDEVPKKAITMGVGKIMQAKKIILLASGKNKAQAIKGMLSGRISTENPATMLQLHSDVTLIIDREIEESLKEI
ncbi:MAG: glucosamine-6-phosphate deaminase [Clostridium sp.]|nr:glucosamine-6-phosphate deaminase [Clostridium sp.]